MKDFAILSPFLSNAEESVYNKLGLQVTDIFTEKESAEYEACSFNLSDYRIISRKAKVTPKKYGQFVTCWKRIESGLIAPFDENDDFRFLIVNILEGKHLGQFIFPKFELMARGIVSTVSKEGKRAFRVYPPGDQTNNKQAQKSQKWQSSFFLPLDENKEIDICLAKRLYSAIQHNS